MFGLLDRVSHRTAKPRFAHPRLEALEDRALPSTVTLAVNYGTGKEITLSGTLSNAQNVANQSITIIGQATGTATTDAQGHYSITLTAAALGGVGARAADGSSDWATVTLTDQAPVLTFFDAVEHSGDIWTFSGTLTYFRYFDTLTVTLNGVPVTVSAGKTTAADNTGHFEFNIMLNGQASDNGYVWVQAISPWGTVSNYLWDLVHQTGT